MEEELLLCLARTRVSGETAARTQALAQSGVNWSYLSSLASRHDVIPLVYHNLSKICSEAVPRNVMSFLLISCGELTRQNLGLAAELLRILDLFRAHDLVALPHKGPALAISAYGDLAFRSFDDLDLLVRSADIPRASELLGSLGYFLENGLPIGRAAASAPVPGQYVFRHKNGRAIVELHTELTMRYFPTAVDLDQLVLRQRPVCLFGTEIPFLCPEDALPMLCVHGAKHFWNRLKWICDIAELVGKTQRMNWKLVEERVSELAGERMLFLGLCLANDLMDAPVPSGLLSRIRANRAVQSMAAQIRKQLFQRIQDERGTAQRLLFRFRMADSSWGGVRYSWRLATKPIREDWSVPGLAPVSSRLSMVLRPLRLLFKYGL